MYAIQIGPRTDKACRLCRLYQGQTRYVHLKIVPKTDKVCTLYRLYRGQTRYIGYTDYTKVRQGMHSAHCKDGSKDRQGMYSVQIVPRTDKVCTLYGLYQGQTKYVHCTDCTKEWQGMFTIQIVPRTNKVCRLYRMYQGQTRYVHYRLHQDRQGM